MIEPQINLHQRNCLTRAENLVDNHMTEDLASDTMQVRGTHHLPYIGDFPTEPSSKKDVSCQ